MLTLIITLGFMWLTLKPNYRVLHVQPLIITMGIIWLTRNYHHGFYMANPKPITGFYEVYPKPSPWVLYGSPETITIGFNITHTTPSKGFIS